MARTRDRLSSRAAAVLKKPGLHADGEGLYLRIDRATTKELREDPDAVGPKRWVFIFQWKGKRTEMGLGSATTVLVKDARLKRDAARKELDEGRNPIEERRVAKAVQPSPEPPPPVKSFGEVADEWYEARKADWTSQKTRDRWTNILTVHCAKLRPLAIDAVNTEAVLGVLKPIWSTIPETAPRVRGGIEDVLDAAKVLGLRSGENPARWKGHLKHILSAPKKLTRGHHPAMPYAELPAFMVALRANPNSSARMLEFNILTAVRPSEAREAGWLELDRAKHIWTIPAGRMKERRIHRVPISPAADAVLEEMRPYRDVGEWVFPGATRGRPMSNMTGAKLMEALGQSAYTVHGFRSTFSDWADQQTDFPRNLVEAALAHLSGDEVERAYRRGEAMEKRRKLMEAWAEFLGATPRAASGES